MSLSRESRLILVLVAFGVVSVAMLGYMAERYRRILEPQSEASADPGPRAPIVAPAAAAAALPPDPRTRVESYLRVREAIAAASVDLVAPGAAQLDDAVGFTLSNLRDVQLIEAGLTPEAYNELKATEARWRAGDPTLGSELRQAFDRHRERLERARVPAYDAWER